LVRWGEYEDAIRTYVAADYFLQDVTADEVISNYRSHLIDNTVPCLPIPADEVRQFGVCQGPGY
jgi:hypothetical protein